MALSTPHLGMNVERLLKSIPGFEDTALAASRAIHGVVLKGGKVTRAAADALHGTWIGHPLHPLLVTIPLGAWVLAELYDLAAIARGSEELGRTADSLITIGVLAAVPTALSGMADYSAIKQDAAAEGLAHAALNGVALSLYLLSLGARAGGKRGIGVALSSLALTVNGASGWLGAELIYRHRVGVNHTPAPASVNGWVAVLSLEDLAVGESRRVLVGDDPVLVHRGPEAVYAIGAVCAHAGGPLEEGAVSGTCVECPWHQSIFDLRDGRVVHGPATQPQPRYETRLLGGLIEVRLPDGAYAPFERESGAAGGSERAIGE